MSAETGHHIITSEVSQQDPRRLVAREVSQNAPQLRRRRRSSPANCQQMSTCGPLAAASADLVPPIDQASSRLVVRDQTLARCRNVCRRSASESESNACWLASPTELRRFMHAASLHAMSPALPNEWQNIQYVVSEYFFTVAGVEPLRSTPHILSTAVKGSL